MLLSDFIQARREKQIEAAKEEGKAEVYREIAKWERRQKETEDRARGSQTPRQHNRRTIHKKIQKNKGITNGSLVKTGDPKLLKRCHSTLTTRSLNYFVSYSVLTIC